MQGVIPILAVPFDETGEIGHAGINGQIDAVARAGGDGIMLFGFGSEYYKLTEADRLAILDTAIEAGNDAELPVYASVTAQATRAAVDDADTYADLGVDGLMILPPHQMNPSEDALLDHLRTVAEVTELPVMIQYAPGAVGVSIAPETFAELSQSVPNVSHYKIESTPPGPYISALLEASDESVEVLVGSAGRELIDALDRGAVGVIPSVGFHEVYLEIIDRYLMGNRTGAIEVHTHVLPLLNQFSGAESFVYFDKWVQADRGIIDSDLAHLRDPASEPDDQSVRLFREHYRRLADRVGL